MAPLIRTFGLSKHYGTTVALDSVDIEVNEGITGLLGANGAGKSTAIKLSLGLIRPTSGSLEVLGQTPNDEVELRARLGYMPEHDCLPSSVNASEFLSHMAQVSGLPPAHARTRAADTLRHVGLHEERYRPMGEYSTGMKQRVKLAQALVHDPTLVFLDEPTTGLDPSGRDEMLELIRRTGREFGINILLSSHLLGDVQRTCDHIIVLDGGRVLRQGPLSGFTGETQTVFVEVDEGHERLVEALLARGIQAIVEGRTVIVERRTDDEYDAIRDALVEADVPLRRLAPRRHVLAEIFRGRIVMTQQQGQVFNIGYQRYDGPRQGRALARRALWVNGVRTALGLGRSWHSKVLPVLLMVSLLIPALVFVLIASILGLGQGLPGHSEYYRIALPILFIFSAIIAPELLCADRRSGVIYLYLVRPLSPLDYVLGRWLAFFTIALAFIYLPQAFLLVGLTLAAADPWAHLRDNWLVVPRFLVSGFVLAVFTTTIPLAVASFTTRRAYAAAFAIGVWLVSFATGMALATQASDAVRAWSALVSLGSVPIYINDMIFGDVSDSPVARIAADLPRAAIVGWYLALTLAVALVLWRRYERIAE